MTSVDASVADVEPVLTGDVVASGHEVVSVAAATQPAYVGLITRGIGFAIDVAAINVVALAVGLFASLIVSFFHLPHPLRVVLEVIAAAAYVAWAAGYFVAFWTTTGQTPGARVMQFRVIAAGGQKLGVRRALVRDVGLVLAALPLFAGYVLIIFDRRRRGFQDRLAKTVVIEAPATAYLQQRRLRRMARARAGLAPAQDARERR